LGRYGREGEAEESCTGPVVILWAGNVYTRDRASADLNIIPWGRIRSVTAQVQELRAEEITARPWSDVARPFFAQPRKRGVDYPLPEKDEFWRVYREPIDRFWEAANTLRSVFEDLARWGEKEYRGHAEEMGINEWSTPTDLNLILSRVKPSIRPSEDKLTWVAQSYSPSLLGILAMQLFWDLSDDKFRALICKQCERPFPSRAKQTLFCSDKCRTNWHRDFTAG